MAAVLALTACHAAGGTQAPGDGVAIPWVEAPLDIVDLNGETQRLEALASGDAGSRVARLDRLLDLLDRARFAQDEQAREALWAALAGHRSGRGAAATRDAAVALLNEATALEESDALDNDARDFLAAAIMLLATDAAVPDDADALSIRTGAFRSLRDEPLHPRVADNAAWRLYDHVRGCLRGAVSAPAGRRADIAAHVHYAWSEDINRYLAGQESIDELDATAMTDAFTQTVAQLKTFARWSSTLEARRADDEELLEAVHVALPARRDQGWAVPVRSGGGTQADSGAPVVHVRPDDVAVDAGRESVVTVGWNPSALAQSVRDVLVRDGRGHVLVVAPPLLPSASLDMLLTAAATADAARLDLGVRGELDGPMTALPIWVVAPDDLGPGAEALRSARLRFHVTGAGAWAEADGDPITAPLRHPEQIATMLADVHAAYPRERALALSLRSDVIYDQLIDVLRGALGQDAGGFELAAWIVDAPAGTADEGESGALPALGARLRWARQGTRTELVQPYPLKPDDQARLETAMERAQLCLPELAAAQGPVSVAVGFVDGKVAEVETKAGHAYSACLREEFVGLRLHTHREALEVTAKFKLGQAEPGPRRTTI